jgi:hypothetical protein
VGSKDGALHQQWPRVNLEQESFLLPLLLCGPVVFFEQEPLLLIDGLPLLLLFFEQEPLLLIDGLPLLLLLFWLVYQIVPIQRAKIIIIIML